VQLWHRRNIKKKDKTRIVIIIIRGHKEY
jgi:hypothetical protein